MSQFLPSACGFIGRTNANPNQTFTIRCQWFHVAQTVFWIGLITVSTAQSCPFFITIWITTIGNFLVWASFYTHHFICDVNEKKYQHIDWYWYVLRINAAFEIYNHRLCWYSNQSSRKRAFQLLLTQKNGSIHFSFRFREKNGDLFLSLSVRCKGKDVFWPPFLYVRFVFAAVEKWKGTFLSKAFCGVTSSLTSMYQAHNSYICKKSGEKKTFFLLHLTDMLRKVNSVWNVFINSHFLMLWPTFSYNLYVLYARLYRTLST